MGSLGQPKPATWKDPLLGCSQKVKGNDDFSGGSQLCDTADMSAVRHSNMSAVRHSRHVRCVTQQTCLLRDTADMSAV